MSLGSAKESAKQADNAKRVIPNSALLSSLAWTRQLQEGSVKPSRDQSRLQQSHAVDNDYAPPDTDVTSQKRKASSQASLVSHLTIMRHLSTRSVSNHGSDKMEEQPVIGGKRRRFPPGSKSKNSHVTAMKKDAKPLVTIPTRTCTPSPARFTVYKCRWRACNAQLHNIATLRQHIAKKHKPPMNVAVEKGHICWWRSCDCLQLDGDDGILPIKSFDSHSDWLGHIEDAHLHPLGKKYGDGPSTTHIGKPMINFNVSKYLSRPL